MPGAIFVIKPDGELETVEQRGYLTEGQLQKYLEDYPALLAGDQIDTVAPRRWLLVRREAPLPDNEGAPDRWSLDHVFLDQAAIPTIVEVKRSSDTRIRREVVGQMLDYAANAVVYLPVERLRQWYEERLPQDADPAEILAEALGSDLEYEQFWGNVATNLKAGRVRLMFVADHVPPELRRIVEFLGTQMNPAEVLAVEVPQFEGGAGTKVIVPRVIGRTAEIERKVSPSTARLKPTDADTFFASLASRPTDRAVAERLRQWTVARKLDVRFTQGRAWVSMRVYLEAQGATYHLFDVGSDGLTWLQFGDLRSRPVFDDAANLAKLVSLLREAGITIPPNREDKYPNLQTSQLANEEVAQAFVDAFDWAINVARGEATITPHTAPD